MPVPGVASPRAEKCSVEKTHASSPVETQEKTRTRRSRSLARATGAFLGHHAGPEDPADADGPRCACAAVLRSCLVALANEKLLTRTGTASIVLDDGNRDGDKLPIGWGLDS